MIEPAVYTALSGSSPITSIVGTRIYPLVLREDTTFPALTYQVISTVTEPTFTSLGVRKYRIQLDCWADTYLGAATLRDAVMTALDGYTDSTIIDSWPAMQADFFAQDGLEYRCMIEFYMLSDQ